MAGSVMAQPLMSPICANFTKTDAVQKGGLALSLAQTNACFSRASRRLQTLFGTPSFDSTHNMPRHEPSKMSQIF